MLRPFQIVLRLKFPTHYGGQGDFSEYDEEREHSMADEGGASAAEFEAEPVLPPEELPKKPLTLVRNEEPPEADWREFGLILAALALVGYYAYRDFRNPPKSRLRVLR